MTTLPCFFFFFNDTATTEIYTLSLHDALPISLEASSGRHAGTDFGVCVNPEFLREGTAVHDYLDPPKTVIGELTRASGKLLASLYAGVPAPLIRTDKIGRASCRERV